MPINICELKFLKALYAAFDIAYKLYAFQYLLYDSQFVLHIVANFVFPIHIKHIDEKVANILTKPL